MARRGRGKQLNPSVSQSEFTRIHQSATIYAPFPTKKGEKPIDYDTRPAKTVENTLLADAIVDRTLCVRAKWSVGWPGSTFSNQITLSRRYALGTNASNNYYYNARGVFPRLDDGRLIRDAYDRRERPGKKRRGAESPADWRRVPRRRPAAAAAARGIAESF